MSSPRKVTAVAYLRVSTDAQAEHGFGLDAQRADVERAARRHGLRIVQECSEAVSGSTEAADRDALTCALDALREGRAEVLLVARLDRLARLLHVQEAALATVWRLDGRVFTADTGEVLQDDPDDPMRKAMRQMMGVFAELDRASIGKRLRDGRRQARAQGRRVGGSAPLGFRAEHGALVPDEQEAATLARAEVLRASGLSWQAVAEALNAEGLPTKRGGTWHATTVRRTLDPAARTEAARQVAAARVRDARVQGRKIAHL